MVIEKYCGKIWAFVFVCIATIICPFSIKASATIVATNLPDFDSFTSAELQCASAIEEGLDSYSDSIDVSKYKLTSSQVQDVFFYVSLQRVDMFYVNMSHFGCVYASDGTVSKVFPKYIISESEYDTAKASLDNAIDSVMSGVNDSWSTVEKALYIHDYIATHCTYYADDEVSGKTIYSVLVEGNAVCVGYSFTFKYLMDMLDVQTICVCDDSHMWNMIEYNGNWYHIDVTWDDPTPDYENVANHYFFMVSDSFIESYDSSHDEWSYGEKASDTSFDKYFWYTSLSQFVYNDSDKLWYGSNINGIISYDFATNTVKTIYKFDENWTISETMALLIPISMVVKYNNCIYFNSSTAIYSYNLSSKAITRIGSSPSCAKSSYQIYTLYIEDNYLKYGIGKVYSEGVLKTAVVKELADTTATTLLAPENITATRSGDNVTLSWDKVDNASCYALYVYNAKNKTATRLKVTDSTTLVAITSGKYIYAVKAITKLDDEYIYSDFTKWVSA